MSSDISSISSRNLDRNNQLINTNISVKTLIWIIKSGGVHEINKKTVAFKPFSLPKFSYDLKYRLVLYIIFLSSAYAQIKRGLLSTIEQRLALSLLYTNVIIIISNIRINLTILNDYNIIVLHFAGLKYVYFTISLFVYLYLPKLSWLRR